MTGLGGTRRLFPGGGELHEVAVGQPFPEAAARPVPPAVPAVAPGWAPREPEPPSPLPAPLPLAEFLGRERGRRFGEKVHRLLEAAPPVGKAWPPEGFSPASIVSWSDGEEHRWNAIVRTIAASRFREELRNASAVGTEFPLLRCRGGWAEEDRADLVAAVPRGARAARGADALEGELDCLVIDYKTGRREKEAEEAYVRQVRGYTETLSAAWRVSVRGLIWYVETGETIEVE